MDSTQPWRYEKLTWPEINRAVKDKKIPIIPVGSLEQHGPHLPLDTDCLCPVGIAEQAAQLNPEQILILPIIPFGYTSHVMDFPGTIDVPYNHLIQIILDICKSLAHHGFAKMILFNGHGSNSPVLDLAARRVNLETNAECIFTSWWSMLTIEKEFMEKYRESIFPGGCAHAGELETSVYLYLDEANVQKHLIQDEIIACNQNNSSFWWVDLFSSGPAPLVTWTSTYTQTGTCGQATLATPEKGKIAVDESARQLVQLVREFCSQPKRVRINHHVTPSLLKNNL